MPVYKRKLQGVMWASGRPYSSEPQLTSYAATYRAALRLGMTDKQALALVKTMYDAANGYEWKIADAPGTYGLHRATIEALAEKHPNGKAAEQLLAEREGRPSRWGTPEFHNAAHGEE